MLQRGGRVCCRNDADVYDPRSMSTTEHHPESPALSRYAVKAGQTRGRMHAEPPDRLRDEFEVDRHRVLSCAAFRRVRAKTQVFGGAEDDHFRTRMTHTLEVAEVARLLARALHVNEALAQVIALAHDLGHPPFGHAGEAALNACMKDHGGFEHNAQTLRVVDYLEHPYPAFRGLNLTFEVREGVIKHASLYDRPELSSADPVTAPLLEAGRWATVEAQIVDLADRLAYDMHDLEDAIGAGLLSPAHLESLSLWREARIARSDLPDAVSVFAIRRPVLDAMLDRVVLDAAAQSMPMLAGIESPDEVRRLPTAALKLSEDVQSGLREVEELLRRDVYLTPRVQRLDEEARRIVTELFEAFVSREDELPPRFRSRVDDLGVFRTVCDYIAGMTDGYCRREWERLVLRRSQR